MFSPEGLAVLLKSLMGKDNHEKLQEFIARGVFERIAKFIDDMERVEMTLMRVEAELDELVKLRESRQRIEATFGSGTGTAAGVQSNNASEPNTDRDNVRLIASS